MKWQLNRVIQKQKEKNEVNKINLCHNFTFFLKKKRGEDGVRGKNHRKP